MSVYTLSPIAESANRNMHQESSRLARVAANHDVLPARRQSIARMRIAVRIEQTDFRCVHDASDGVEADDRTDDLVGVVTTKAGPENDEIACRQNISNTLSPVTHVAVSQVA